jgi:hypothetical protein
MVPHHLSQHLDAFEIIADQLKISAVRLWIGQKKI